MFYHSLHIDIRVLPVFSYELYLYEHLELRIACIVFHSTYIEPVSDHCADECDHEVYVPSKIFDYNFLQGMEMIFVSLWL